MLPSRRRLVGFAIGAPRPCPRTRRCLHAARDQPLSVRGVSTVVDGIAAGAVAGVLSGLPSTIHALLVSGQPLAATLAVGSLVLPNEDRRGRLLLAAIPVHLAISVGWGVALAFVLPRRNVVALGPAAGLAIAAVDLGLVGRRLPPIRTLPTGPQIGDHVAYGAIVGVILHRRSHSIAVPR